VVDFLKVFCMARGGYWRRFLDRRGHVRLKKFPNLPEARERLVRQCQTITARIDNGEQ
jgi:hypothetical protein